MRSFFNPCIVQLALAVALCVISLFMRKRAHGCALAALVCTLVWMISESLRVWSTDLAEVLAFSEGIDPATRYRELLAIFQRTDVMARTTVAVGACAFVGATICVFRCEWGRFQRLGRGVVVALIVANVIALVSASALSRRSATLRRDTFASLAKTVTTATTHDDSCAALEDAYAIGDTMTIDSVIPDARERARTCVAERLTCLEEHEAECSNILRGKTEAWNLLHPGTRATPIRLFVLESPLPLDEQQKTRAAQIANGT